MLNVGLPGMHELFVWMSSVLDGMAEPWVIAVVLALTTLLLEDVAIAAGVSLATAGFISWELSLLAVGGGIALGDLGLYAMGAAGRSWRWWQRGHRRERALALRSRLQAHLFSAVMVARVVPGLRLLTYTACGLLSVPLAPFAAWVLLAVALWTLGLYALSVTIGQALAHALGVPPAVAVALPVIVLAIAAPLARHLIDRFRRRKEAVT